MIEGSEYTVYVQRGGTSITASPDFRDWQVARWSIQAVDKSAVVVVDYVQLYVAERRKCSNICHFILFIVSFFVR